MAETRDFLLEIGCEEMPSAPLMKAQEQLGTLVEKGLAAAGLAHGAIRTLSTPRRLAVIVDACATATEEIHEVLRGPKTSIAFDADGNPTRAAEGFARKNNTTAQELVRRVEADGNEYVFAERFVASVPATELLSKLCEETIGAIQWPNYRSQRWGSTHATFVRPVRWICALLGTDVVPVSFADVTSSNTTRGHRVLAPGDHVVSEPAVYEQVLEQAFVMGEERRRAVIREGIAKIEAERGGAHVDTPKGTFDEVVNLCEWPTVLVGKFDEEFLHVPHEIICESMLSNQRYFPVYDASGELTREFVLVSNGDPAVSATVVDGNERVVRARLYDAKFFYDEDLKVPMEKFNDRLESVVFQEKLGTVRQKVTRLEKLAAEIGRSAGLDAPTCALAVRAAHLCKADLVSQAVVEFTNQQGVMGGYYALAAGEDPRVAAAIRDHYRPRFAGDEIPEDVVSRVVAAADKLDTICGMFAIDEPPTGSSDPFAVRRATIGVIALLRTMPQADLRKLISVALDSYAQQGLVFAHDDAQGAVERYFLGRLAAIVRGEDVNPDVVEAISSIGVINPVDFVRRAKALEKARAEQPEVFEDLATAFARAAHLADASLGTSVDESLLSLPEQLLLTASQKGAEAVRRAFEEGSYEAAFQALAALRGPIDRFFEDVLVMDEDSEVRCNRLRLLNRFTEVFRGVADIGQLARKK